MLSFYYRLDDNFIIRIADFGLSENVYAKKYFRMENHKAVKLPIKWMAPESLNDGLFTEKSDVVGDGACRGIICIILHKDIHTLLLSSDVNCNTRAASLASFPGLPQLLF